MLHMLIKSGIAGMLIGIGAQANDLGRVPVNLDSVPRMKEVDCRQFVPPAGDSIYRIRSLGRAEARLTGRKISGKVEEMNDIGMHDGRQVVRVYGLRSLIRVEARHTEKDHSRDVGAAEDEMGHSGGQVARAPDRGIYGLRTLGRAEAHWTGLKICEERSIPR